MKFTNTSLPAALLLVGFLFMRKYLTETKGKTLEEIEAELGLMKGKKD